MVLWSVSVYRSRTKNQANVKSLEARAFEVGKGYFDSIEMLSLRHLLVFLTESKIEDLQRLIALFKSVI